MTLSELLNNYVGGNAVLTIQTLDGGYLIEEEEYDYYVSDISDHEDDISGNNPNHVKDTWIGQEAWWNEAKDCEVLEWNVISDPAEVCVKIDM